MILTRLSFAPTDSTSATTAVFPYKWNSSAGLLVPIPTLPVSSTVTTCDAPSYNLIKSPEPLCVTATATLVPAVVTSILSTSIKLVSKVVVVPFIVRSPVTVKSPVTAASLTVILSVDLRTALPVLP